MKSFTQLTLAICLSTSFASSLALAVDFNSIINENSKAQQDLHTQIKQTVEEVRIAAQNESANGPQEKYIADTAGQSTINVKTNKAFLKFAKEKSFYKPSQVKSDKRLAQEIQELE